MSFTQEELEYMRQLSEKNPNNQTLLSILNKMKGDTAESLIQKIIETASETHPDNPNEFIMSSKYDGSNMVSFLTEFASGNIPPSDLEFNTDFNMRDMNSEPWGHQCDVTYDDVENLKEIFINCVCKENPHSPHVIVYNLMKSLKPAYEAIKSICCENKSQIEMKVHSSPGWNYRVPIQNILSSCFSSLPLIYLKRKHEYMQVNCSGEPINESKEWSD
jgi:GTPase Era involved in 16S rRNA processing